jgi:hypothetical protein
MSDHDSPISLHGGVTIAKAIMTEKDGNVSLPEGTILASSTKRVLSFPLRIQMDWHECINYQSRKK